MIAFFNPENSLAFFPVVIHDVVIHENTFRSAVEILELTRPDRPQKAGKAKQTQKKRGGDEDDEDVHDFSGTVFFQSVRRMALNVTNMDDDDMAIAAMSGVTTPANASGMAMEL